MSWEDKFQTWSQPPSKTEQDKCDNAERAIKEAIHDDEELSALDVRVFAQGSYSARTNISLDSDVDICVCLQEPFFTRLPPGVAQEELGLVDGSISFQKFKQLVENALVNKFGRDGVTRGNKAFDIHENTYRIDADVVPAFAYRWYFDEPDQRGTYQFITPTGIKFLPDNGGEVINWPDQTYANGVAKNDRTGRRYKGIIRILKRLRNEMQDEEIAGADDIASFLIESLVWNTPDEGFGNDKLTADVRYILAHCFNNTLKEEECKEWLEVNDVKYLFHPVQPWTREQAHEFLSAAWDYIGFK